MSAFTFTQRCFFPLANQQISRSNLWVLGFKSSELKRATRQQIQNNLKLSPFQAVCLFALKTICGIYRETVATLPHWQTFLQVFCHFRTDCCSICAFAETVDPVEAELFIREAQVSDPWLGSSTTRAGVYYWVPNTAVLKPASLTAIQELKFPGCIQLTHFGHQ